MHHCTSVALQSLHEGMGYDMHQSVAVKYPIFEQQIAIFDFFFENALKLMQFFLS